MATEPLTKNGRQLYQRLQTRIEEGMTEVDLQRILISHFVNIAYEPQFFTQLFVNGATAQTSDELTTERPNRVHRREYVADVISRNKRINGMIVALEVSDNGHVIENMLHDPDINRGVELHEAASRYSQLPSTAVPSGLTWILPSSATSQTLASADGSSHVTQVTYENYGTSIYQEAANTETTQKETEEWLDFFQNHGPKRNQEPPQAAGDPAAQRKEWLRAWLLDHRFPGNYPSQCPVKISNTPDAE